MSTRARRPTHRTALHAATQRGNVAATGRRMFEATVLGIEDQPERAVAPVTRQGRML